MQKLRSEISTGEHVDVRGEGWLVVRREAFDECSLVTLRGASDGNFGETARLLVPFDRIARSQVPSGIARVSRSCVLRRAASAVARAHGWCDPWTAAGANIDLFPWQLEPALAAVAGATRLLLADDVGLGKTIQAGLILAELGARGLISRALVLTPASLREQWASELGDRFGLDPLVMDHAALARLASELPVGVNPWSTADLVVSSIDLVKRPDVRTALDGVTFDALIVDEAHHLKPGSDRGALVADLARRVPWIALATATPHSGDERDYAFLCSLGAVGSGEHLRVFRRRARDVGQPRRRRARFRAIAATAAERTLHHDTLEYARAVWRLQQDGERHAAIVASVICRRAVSSARAVLRTLERRRALLSEANPLTALQPSLPWDEGDAADDVEADEILASAGLADRIGELHWLDRLVLLARRAAPSSSKASLIERLLDRTSEPVLVFSEYRDTIAHLQERLARHATLAVLHGAMSARERRESVQRFVGGAARVLLATDAAGEGLNLQARCRVVINVELPWNPLRLEQRIGRVDRLGQTRRVHALSLFHRRSFEDEVLARLHRRMQKADHTLEELRVDERAIAAAIFDDRPVVEAATHLRRNTLDAGGCALAATAALGRRAMFLAKSGPPMSPRAKAVCTAPSRRRRLVDRFVLLFESDAHDSRGRLVAREILPIAVWASPALAVRPGSVRQLSRLLASSSSVRDIVTDALAARTTTTRAAALRTAAALAERLERLLSQASAAEPVLFQTSLFDRRAEQRARANDAAIAVWRAHLQHRLDEARGLSGTVGSHPPRLIAVWPASAE